ncbi:UDP-glucose 4-epimerase GalE [Oceanobacillus sp. 1P07AA]|uniref:UDP-glucose 4-epimerase GalE n=1 Tax=Oceanobacillus sp. 1P07AA TaxID=3132293 RepID=UPI0039A72FE0
MSVLVLGGAGYIGSHAVYQLIEEGHQVIVIDNLITGHKKAIHRDATFYYGDIRDLHFLHTVFEKEDIEVVFHFAASSLVGESMEQPLDYFDNNVYGTQQVLKAMVAANVGKIIFSSTAATYGEPVSIPLTEDMPTMPTSPYGESKRMMEKLMRWAEEAHDIKYVSLRYFNVAGAKENSEIGEDHYPETHLIPIVLQVALGQRENITIFGDDYDTSDGTCIRDYVHVEDLIDAHLLAWKYLNQGSNSLICNLGSNNGFSVKEIIETARKITGKNIPIKIGVRRAGDPSKLIASASKAQQELHWHPKRTSIEKIITDAWNWHEKHPHGYGKED